MATLDESRLSEQAVENRRLHVQHGKLIELLFAKQISHDEYVKRATPYRITRSAPEAEPFRAEVRAVLRDFVLGESRFEDFARRYLQVYDELPEWVFSGDELARFSELSEAIRSLCHTADGSKPDATAIREIHREAQELL